MTARDIVVIGGSKGAFEPLAAIVSQLPADLSAAVFVVLHLPPGGNGGLAARIAGRSALPVRTAADGLPIAAGTITLGAGDRHLLLAGDRVRLGSGPRETMARPAIDPLFRSAALAFGPRVIGVILSGLLGDGAAGLAAIARCGGLAMVQDPREALADAMPRNALQATPVDCVLPAARLGQRLAERTREPAGRRRPVPPDLALDVDIAAGPPIGRPGEAPAERCPVCAGRLQRKLPPPRSPEPRRPPPTPSKDIALESAMRLALRIVEERAGVLARMGEEGRGRGCPALVDLYAGRARECRDHAAAIRAAIMATRGAPALRTTFPVQPGSAACECKTA